MLWPALRLVAHQWVKLEDLQTRMNVNDMLILNDALDAWLEAQAQAQASKPTQ